MRQVFIGRRNTAEAGYWPQCLERETTGRIGEPIRPVYFAGSRLVRGMPERQDAGAKRKNNKPSILLFLLIACFLSFRYAMTVRAVLYPLQGGCAWPGHSNSIKNAGESRMRFPLR
jgi:hypothetical protein